MASLIFLIWTLGSILVTINVFFSFSNKSHLSFKFILTSFFLGLIIGDFLPQWLILNLGILVIFSFSDIFSSSIGITGIICHIICWIILSIRLWIVLNVSERLNIKMIDSFGIKWEKNSTKNFKKNNIFDIDWQSWFNPFKSIKDPRIEILRDQVYYSEKGMELKLDIYKPKNFKKNRPGIIQIHGGAWITGSKRQASFFLARMASKGWICYSVSHRFSPEVFFPEHLVDIKLALKWIREKANKHGLDKNFIISKGGSSGGHLATLIALTQNNPEFQPGFEKSDTSIQGCIPLYAVYSFYDSFDKDNLYPAKSKLLKMVCGGSPEKKTEIYKKITPANWISKNSPPFLIIHGETDTLISIEEPRKFWKELKSKNVSFSGLLSLPLIEHGFDVFPTLTAQSIVPLIEQYLKMIHKNYLDKK